MVFWVEEGGKEGDGSRRCGMAFGAIPTAWEGAGSNPADACSLFEDGIKGDLAAAMEDGDMSFDENNALGINESRDG